MNDQAQTPQIMDLITYPVTDEGLAELRGKYLALKVSNLEDSGGYESCKLGRADCRELRGLIEKRRKELKADSLEFGRHVDAEAKKITTEIERVENHLVGQMKVIDDENARIKAQKEREAAEEFKRRIAALQEVGARFDFESVRAMKSDEFAAFYVTAETAHTAKRQKERAEKEAAEAKRAEEAAERERLAAEKRELEEKLLAAKRESEEKDRQAEKERADREASEKREREEREREIAKANEEREAADKRVRDAEAKLEAKRLDDENRKLFEQTTGHKVPEPIIHIDAALIPKRPDVQKLDVSTHDKPDQFIHVDRFTGEIVDPAKHPHPTYVGVDPGFLPDQSGNGRDAKRFGVTLPFGDGPLINAEKMSDVELMGWIRGLCPDLESAWRTLFGLLRDRGEMLKALRTMEGK